MNTIQNQTMEDKIRAAYALNLCTVSVSQIIDYDDFNILDQEYNVILNNLNLEEMPKDEALLNVIKQLLDTITYFRIDEVERKIIDEEYQYDMQNAIWNAIPHFGVLFVGANPVTAAISLATQVGTSYINYRRNKANALKNKERSLWQLQRSAIEQFNGLRRELFDTAWRLADTYQFPDALRLTESQIDQYNEILMDTNLIRRYERLNTIKNNFTAYPPFWYFFGHTAAEISFDETMNLSVDDKKYYIEKAKEYFQIFYDSRSYNLLRVNHIASAGALEYAALLNATSDNKFIKELISYAVSKAGNANDILELCAMEYLKLSEYEAAASILSILVNESYNTKVNAQLLSSIYAKLMCDGDEQTRIDIRRKYTVLANNINQKYLFPLPTKLLTPDAVIDRQMTFIENQKDVLKKEFDYIFEYFFDMYSYNFNKIVPLPIKEYDSDRDDHLYLEICLNDRLAEAMKYFINEENGNAYKRRLGNISYAGSIIELLNNMFVDLQKMPFITGENRNNLWQLVRIQLELRGDEVNDIITSFRSADTYSYKKYQRLQGITLSSFTETMQEELKQITYEGIEGLQTVTDCSDFEYALQQFCIEMDIDLPEIMIDTPAQNELIVSDDVFTVDMLGTEATSQDVIAKITQEMTNLIYQKKDRMVNPKNSQLSVLVKNTTGFNQYFATTRFNRGKNSLRYDAIAVIDDKGAFFPDLIFTNQMIQLVSYGSISAAVSYDRISISADHKKLKLGKKEYSNKSVDMNVLWEVVQELRQMCVPITKARASSIIAVAGHASIKKGWKPVETKKLYWTK